MDCLNSVKSIIKGREKEKFVSLKSKSMLRNLREDGKDQEYDLFMTDVLLMYNSCSAYLEQWTKSFTEFESFDWMLLSKNSNMNWDKIDLVLNILLIKMLKLMIQSYLISFELMYVSKKLSISGRRLILQQYAGS